MKVKLGLTLALTLSMSALPAFAGDEQVKAIKELQGDRRGLRAKMNGQRISVDVAAAARMIVKGDEIEFPAPNLLCKFTSRPGKTPAISTSRLFADWEKGKTRAGIYSLIEGRLTIRTEPGLLRLDLKEFKDVARGQPRSGGVGSPAADVASRKWLDKAE